MMTRVGLMALGLAVTAAVTAEAKSYTVKSPDGRNAIVLETEPSLTYCVSRDGVTLVKPSPLALSVAGRAPLGPGARAVGEKASRRTAKEPAPLYKKAFLDELANESLVSFAGDWAVRLVARNDGVAYRFETAFGGTVKVTGETASVVLPSGETRVLYASNNGAWRNVDPFQCSWEKWYLPGAVKDLSSDWKGLYYAPIVFLFDKAAMAVTESDLFDYPGWNFRRAADDPATLAGCFAKWPTAMVNYDWALGVTDYVTRYKKVERRADYLVETSGTRTYPWRTFILADSVVTLPEQDIVCALARPNATGDTSWIKPGKVAWDWWNDWNVSGVDFRAGCNTKTYEHYIDFAAKNGIEYVIFDEGWSQKLKIMEIHPDVDVPHLIRYGAERGVGIILWAAWSQFLGREEAVVAHYAKMGAKGFKVDFMDRDDAEMLRFLERFSSICAKHRMVVDYHGMFKPTGLQRTYPNVLNFEGVAGLEQMKWDRPYDSMSNDCILAYTRMVAGPMDYTPGAMRNYCKGTYTANGSRPGSEGTRVHQMALMTLYEAPLQMLCDSPTQYLKNRECFDFMAKVPVVWDDTKGLFGEPGRSVAIARRKGTDWWVGAIVNWDGGKAELDTAFLGSGTWKADVFQDGINADRDAEDYARRTLTVRAGERLPLAFAPGGGWTARFTPDRR